MLKDYWFKIRNKRTEKVSETVLDDLKWFLDLNYVSEEAAGGATAELYESVTLSQEAEPESIPWAADECIGELKVLPTEDDYPAVYSYSSGDVDSVGSAAAYEIDDADEAFEDIEDEFLYERSFSTVQEPSELPQAPAGSGKGRGLPSFPQLKREEKAKGESLQAPQLQQQSLENVIAALGLTFQQQLLGLIDAKGYTDAQVYRKANLDRKLFSKIRCNKDYKPSKLTALSLAIALELNLDEATDLLGRAGLALSPSNLTDMIIKYCITHQIYDIYDVNALLYEHDQQLLGC